MDENKLKKFCENELQSVREWGADRKCAIQRCLGAVMFFLSVYPDDCEYEGIGWWWDNEMRPQFDEV